jgi:hypothetical protein
LHDWSLSEDLVALGIDAAAMSPSRPRKSRVDQGKAFLADAAGSERTAEWREM